jgi:hypothetical protein
MKNFIKIFIYSICLFVLVDSVFAEQEAIDKVSKASDASFDKRLPPVLPGEEVRDGDKKIKVWSTSGSMSVSEVPPVPQAPSVGDNHVKIDEVGVVVDQRKDHLK